MDIEVPLLGGAWWWQHYVHSGIERFDVPRDDIPDSLHSARMIEATFSTRVVAPRMRPLPRSKGAER